MEGLGHLELPPLGALPDALDQDEGRLRAITGGLTRSTTARLHAEGPKDQGEEAANSEFVRVTIGYFDSFANPDSKQ